MRVSTSQIYDNGISGITSNQATLYKTQAQLAAGRRVLTPSDDPVASARALVVTQSLNVSERYIENQTTANSSLALVEGYTQSAVNLIQNVRERLVEAGNTSLTNSDRQAIATELEARLQELVGLANSQDGAGRYLFSGYMSSTTPFSTDSTGKITYNGDSGERLLQVEATRFMPASVAGDDLFVNSRMGNGTFETRTGGNLSVNGAPPPAYTNNGYNTGTAMVTPGSVSDPAKWASANNPRDFMVRFSVATAADGTKTTTYRLYDNRNPANPVDISGAAQPYVAGQAIALADNTAVPVEDYGGSFIVKGAPNDGDSFTVTPSGTQSLFATLENAIAALNTPVGTTYTSTQLVNDIAAELSNIDQNLDNVNRVQAKLGARMNELDSLQATSESVSVQYKTTISGLVDLDYAKAISDFAKQQTQLEAAQASYAKIMQLGLFNYL
ncbi:flagellar hook-associated protein FlgL [Rhodocyclus tenuis]|uniref:Flagellar hook-associated protein 3 FlgL n=1 Tax=Rhodocyclus tenuis TaxID=1066 RepID=A0A840GDQ5_RHOTE|nr:flagellar hook-associated protein FlgL [Rhodocyclus tenuis]MBB4246692.1 flagellar hook-associated protein 3 FlgL [Rhodocyclus tenuis]